MSPTREATAVAPASRTPNPEALVPNPVEVEATRSESGGPDSGPRRLGPHLRSLPNRITALRLAMVPVLWGVALLGSPTVVGLGIATAAGTDVLDGYLARRTGQVSEFGGRLDSVADHSLTASTALWLAWLRPDFVRQEWPLLASWAALALLALLAGWVRFRRIGDLHFHSAKAAGALGYLFAIWLLVAGRYSQAVFLLVIGVCHLAALETLAAALLLPRFPTGQGSLRAALRRAHADRQRVD